MTPGASVASGRYQLTRELGAGGNGVVWLASHTAMNADVVIKFPLRWKRGSDQSDQLREEAKWLAALSNKHPSIVNILDVGEADGQGFVVMQYMQNGSLQNYCGRRSAEESSGALWERVSWLEQIADALDCIHKNGLIHRDVKPENILLDESLSAYLSDFGIAVGADPTSGPASEEGVVVGSLPYIAPELLRGNQPSPASDQFALGATIYEFVAGAPPFRGKSGPTVLESQRACWESWEARDGIPGFARGVAAALRRALAADASARFPSCAELAGDVRSAWPQMSVGRPPIPTGVERETITSKETTQQHGVGPPTTQSVPSPPPPVKRGAKEDRPRKKLSLQRLLGEDKPDDPQPD